MTANMGPLPGAPRAMDYALDQYSKRTVELGLDLQPIDIDLPMSRFRILRLLNAAQVAEIHNPRPKDLPFDEDHGDSTTD
jgi:hypothetical protein